MSDTLILIEIFGWIEVPLVWFLFKRYAKRNVLGEMAASCVFGIFFEVVSEPLWDYHMAVTFYRDTPVVAITGWMVMFTLVVVMSEKLYRFALREERIIPYDKRIVLFDILAGIIVCLPLETFGARTGVWTYRTELLKWNWDSLIPVFKVPYEVVWCYALLMLIAPTFVRYWAKSFERVSPE